MKWGGKPLRAVLINFIYYCLMLIIRFYRMLLLRQPIAVDLFIHSTAIAIAGSRSKSRKSRVSQRISSIMSFTFCFPNGFLPFRFYFSRLSRVSQCHSSQFYLLTLALATVFRNSQFMIFCAVFLISFSPLSKPRKK